MFIRKSRTASVKFDPIQNAARINARIITANSLFIKSISLDRTAQKNEVIKNLLEAIYHGSEEAADKLLEEIFQNSFADDDLTKIINKLRSYSDNCVTQLLLAKIYAGKYEQTGSEKKLIPVLNELLETRKNSAVSFAMQALNLDSNKAHQFLTDAFWKGIGCIEENEEECLNLNLSLDLKGKLAATFWLGWYYLQKANKNAGYEYLLRVTRSKNMDLAHRALEILCQKCQNQLEITNLLQIEIKNNNAFIALYSAYVACPDEIKPPLKINLQLPSSFIKCMTYQEKSLEKVREYLVVVLNGNNTRYKNIARLFFKHLQEIDTQFAVSNKLIYQSF